MKNEKTNFFRACILPSCALAALVCTVASAHAGTLWNGPVTNYTQSDDNPIDELIPGAVSLTRAGNQWLYNPDGGDTGPAPGTPSDTEWAFGTLADTNLTYESFDSYRNGDLSARLTPNKPMVMHMINEDIYVEVTFTSWPQHGGFFAYKRTTPAVAVAPTVSITSPAAGATFNASASISLTVNVSDPTTTNVQYYAGTTLLGNSTTTPYSLTTSIATAGSYALTAVATAGGLSGTSSVVNITVRPTVSITSPTTGATFTAPASVTLDAGSTAGGVTNVKYFSGSTQIGSATVTPFQLVTNNVAAGSYSFTAVATAAGITATSSVVNITVKPPTPTVSITNPASGAVFAAPANVQIGASASVATGTITNVTFYQGNSSLGTTTAAPFTLTANSLGTGSYSLSAVATAAGISATSTVVNISVVTPVAVSLSAPAISNNKFIFSYSANPGLSYVVRSSSDFVNWTYLSTNVAASNPVIVTNTVIGTNLFYQVGRVTN